MFKYRGCKGESTVTGGFVWMITFEDGTHDMAGLLDAIAPARRASF